MRLAKLILAFVVGLGLLSLAPRASAHEGPHIRFMHLAPGVSAFDVYLSQFDPNPLVKNLKFKSATDYLALDGASFDFVLTAAGDKTPLTEKPFSLSFFADEGSAFTLA